MKSKIQVLISTMNNTTDLLERLNITTDAVVINQCSFSDKKILNFCGHNVLWLDTPTRGLSISRNLAIENSSADFLVIGDDDEVFSDDLEMTVETAFTAHPDMDVIAFQVHGIEDKFKDYCCNEYEISRMKSMQLSSVELCFRRRSLMEHHLRFNQSFGSGAQYKMGEENIFLFDCYRNNLRVYYIPRRIAWLHIGESTWFRGFNEKYFIDRGATYYEMFGWLSVPMVLQFVVRKYRLFSHEISAFKAISHALRGISQRRTEKKQDT